MTDLTEFDRFVSIIYQNRKRICDSEIIKFISHLAFPAPPAPSFNLLILAILASGAHSGSATAVPPAAGAGPDLTTATASLRIHTTARCVRKRRDGTGTQEPTRPNKNPHPHYCTFFLAAQLAPDCSLSFSHSHLARRRWRLLSCEGVSFPPHSLSCARARQPGSGGMSALLRESDLFIVSMLLFVEFTMKLGIS